MGEYNNFIESLNDELTLYNHNYVFNIPKVTVIIPAFNVEDYIYDCLISLVKQTLKEIEIIIINDGSTDNTFSIISTFAQYDKRIKIVNQSNQKSGAARNKAIKLAKGEYITFVDSDDTIELTTLETFYNTAKSNGNDIVICGAYTIKYGKFKKGYYSIEKIPKKLKNKNLNSKTIKENILTLPPIAWAKLYKTKFLTENRILFQEGCNGEDQIFFIETVLLANKIYIIDKNYYYYRKDRPTSLTHSKQKNDNSVILNFYEIEKFLQKQNIAQELNFKILNKYFIKSASWLGKCSKQYKEIYFNKFKNLQLHLRNIYPKYYWGKLNLKENDSYLIIKIKIFTTQLLLNRGINNAK